MVMVFNKERFAFNEGKTELATISLAEQCADKNETFDEVMVRSLKAIVRQLQNKGCNDAQILGALSSAIPYLSDLVRTYKKKTASYREFNLPH